jgi:hypothetical protein
MADIEVRAGDTEPGIDVVLRDGADNPVDLTAADTVTVRLLDATLTEIWAHPGQIDPTTVGRVTYDWTDAAETSLTTTGLGLEFVVKTGTRQRTFPLAGPLSVEFVAPLPAAGLPIQPDEVVDEAGLTPLSQTSDPARRRRKLAALIREVVSEVETFLRRPMTGGPYQELTYPPSYTGGVYQLEHNPVIRIISAVSQPGGDLVTYLGGPTVDIPAIRGYIVEHVAARYRSSLPPGDPDRTVTTVSVEGQSISYAITGRTAASGAQTAGDPPTLQSLSYWRRRGVFTRAHAKDPFEIIPVGVELDTALDTAGLPPGWSAGDL